MRPKFPQDAPREPESGALIGERYRVDAALSRGGSARLYRVLDVAGGRTLALKLLNVDAHPKLRELFELEYQTLASLQHPRIPRAFDFGSDPLGRFYTMELLQGSDLGEHAPLPWRSVIGYLRDASQALGLLHARKLIHRDVSPRNLWRTPDGRVKLIDFGALAPFGVHTQVIGTPPLVPPEATTTGALDQRADLYALGGVAYFLLTGRHAFPARSLRDLPACWGKALVPPSQIVAQLAQPSLPEVPRELDALVLALLSGSELVRPSSTAEVIDRLDALCGAELEPEHEAAHARIRNPQYLKRPRPYQRLSRCFALALRGRGQACTVESAPFGGRSRALSELALGARTSHAHVVHVDAAAEDGMYGVASALALAVLDAMPERARVAAEPHAPLLAHLSVRVRERLEVTPAPLPAAAGELRVLIQEAQRDWFLSLARTRPLVVLVDGLEAADDGSVAFLLALALSLSLSDAKLLLVCALVREPGRERSTALRAFVKAVRSLVLPPLSEADTHALLQSVFGAAEHLSRLSSRVFELAHGLPGHALELCRQLVDRGAISFESGTWVLPRELDVRGLSESREQVLHARLSRVTGPARELARVLSLHSAALTPGLCRALAASQGTDLLPHLGELLGAEILVTSGSRLLFAHEQLRQVCAGELTPEALQRARQALAAQLLAASDGDALDRLRAAVHWTAAGDPRGPAMVVRESSQLFSHEVDKLSAAAPAIEAALQVFRERGCSAYQQVTLLTALALAGYEGERRCVLHYGPQAVAALETLLGLQNARSLRRGLGARIGLLAALALAALGFAQRRKDPCVPSFDEAMIMLFTAVAASAGASSICFDPTAAARLTDVLQPFAALGPDHAAGFMYGFCRTIVLAARDRHHVTRAHWQALLERIDRSTLLDHIPEAQRRRCRGGALFGLAGVETLRDGPQALRMAEALDRNGLPLDRVYADQIRTIYYGSRGSMREYEHYRQRAEHHAIARGTTWQIETWLPGSTSAIALPLHDALLMKSASEQMRRQSEHIPALEVHARHMRGAYLLLRRKYAEAVPWLEDCLRELPGSRMAWARSHGVLARAYNRQGDYERAQAACARVFEHYTDDDFEFAILNLIVQTESVIAEAGLGRPTAARDSLAQLRSQHAASDNPLLRGQLYETALELELMAGDHDRARAELGQLQVLYVPLGIPSLAQHCEWLSARIDALAAQGRGVKLTLPAPANENSAGAPAEQSSARSEDEAAWRAVMLAGNSR